MSALITHRLDNGLEIVVGASPAGPPVTCSLLAYRSGSAREGPGMTGASHLLEHMMFKGTGALPKGEIDRRTQRAGGRNNAYTHHDYTAYYFAFAADRWPLALEIEADRMTGCALDPDELEAEREVVLQELYGALDEPWGQLDQEMWATVFRHHPYRHPILGWQPDLERLDAASLRRYYAQHYVPNNALLVVCGAVDPSEVVEQAERTLGRIPSGPPVLDPPGPPEPEQLGERRVLLRGTTSTTRLAQAYRSAPYGTPEHYALLLAETVLSEGKCSRLYQRLVDGERLVRTVDAQAEGKREDGLFWVVAELLDGAQLAEVERVLDDELARLAGQPPGDEEMARALAHAETGHLFQLERASSWAFAIAHATAIRSLDAFTGHLDALRAVRAEQVSAAVGRHLRPERRTTGVHAPRERP